MDWYNGVCPGCSGACRLSFIYCPWCGEQIQNKVEKEKYNIREFIEVKCQSIGCKNKVQVLRNRAYYGILCKEHMMTNIYSAK